MCEASVPWAWQMPCRARETHIKELTQSAWGKLGGLGIAYSECEECQTQYSEVQRIEPTRAGLPDRFDRSGFDNWKHDGCVRVLFEASHAEYEEHRYRAQGSH